MGKRKKRINKDHFEGHVKGPVQKRFTLTDYVSMNLIVWAFIGMVALSFYASSGFRVDRFHAGILRYILLYAFGCVFFIVSIIDYAECSYSRRNTSASRRDS